MLAPQRLVPQESMLKLQRLPDPLALQVNVQDQSVGVEDVMGPDHVPDIQSKLVIG